MGGVNFGPGEFQNIVAEVVGYKSGLALDVDELCRHTPEPLQGIWKAAQSGQSVRVPSDVYNDLIRRLLVNLGAASPDALENPSMMLLRLAHEYPAEAEMITDIHQRATKWMFSSLRDFVQSGLSGSRTLDPEPFFSEVSEAHGDEGLAVALRFIKAMDQFNAADPWSELRRFEWEDTVDLKDLFDSDDVEPSHGRYLDQRFIDFLNENFDSLDSMHWRKFEALTAEFFERGGFDVKLGAGRDDDGVDVRATWTNGSEQSVIIIQCKKWKRKVGKVYVKALHSDVEHAGAEAGLLVSLKGLQPGAEEVIRTRAYSVSSADRQHLREWLRAMRSPGTGVSVLAEV